MPLPNEHEDEFRRAFDAFVPGRIAVLGIVATEERVLLIRKKRGLGAGKLVPPGGHVEAGESPDTACVRELQEELHITPISPSERACIDFQFRDGLAMRVHVFLASAFTGRETETDEALPLWFPRAALPYAEMWADDPLWLPHVLAGAYVRGRFLFDQDRMLHGEVEPTFTF
ncbi:MAG: 8-oxo-dGTP diphosphatase [Polyangiaceae bacterium]